jgi:murein endopeptidase
MIRLVVDVARTVARSGLVIGVGDISFEQGGKMPPHSTHQTGNADVRLHAAQADLQLVVAELRYGLGEAVRGRPPAATA